MAGEGNDGVVHPERMRDILESVAEPRNSLKTEVEPRRFVEPTDSVTKKFEKLARDAQHTLKIAIQNAKDQEARDALMAKQMAFEEALRTFKESRMSGSAGPDGRAQQESDWERSTRKGKEGSSAETSAFNSEWKIAMLGLVSMLVEFNKALHNSVTEFLMMPTFAIRHQLLPQIWEKISSLATSDPEPVIPILIHEVRLNDENALMVNLTFSGSLAPESQTEGESFDDQFKSIVVEWLKERGYRPDPDPTHKDQFINSQGEPLTAAAFEVLKNDPVDGLQQFLSVESELKFQPRM